jgi:hypothetical protein
MDKAHDCGKRNSRTQAATEPIQFVLAAVSSKSKVEQSNPTFHYRSFAWACGLRTLCFRTLRSGALPGKRLHPSSRLLGFPNSGSLHSCHTDIGQYRSGGFIYRFNPRIANLCSVNNRTLAISRRTRTHPSLPRCQRCSNLAENRHAHSWSPACIPNSMYRQRRINLDDLVSRMDPCARRE